MSLLNDIGDFLFGWLIPDQEYMGGTEVTLQSPQAEPLIYGDVKNAEGIIVKSTIINPVDSDDIPNDLLYLQVVWSVGYIESIDQIYLDDLPIDSTAFDADDGGRWVQHHNETDGGSMTVADIPYHSKGYSYSVIRLEYDPEKMNKLPKITADIKGVKVNPVEGGAKAYSDNYSDILNDYMTNTDYGRGLAQSRMNSARLQAEKTFSGQLVYPYDNSPEYQPLMSCNVRLDLNNTILSNVNKILKGCRGFLPWIDGQFHFYIERDGVSSGSLTESNRMSDFIVEDNEIKDRYNKVIVKYSDRLQQGKPASAEYPVDDAEYQTYLAEDNGQKLPKTITLETVNNKYEALQAAEIILKRSRNALTVKTSSKSNLKHLGVGMIMDVSDYAYGMLNKPFLIVNKKTKANGIIDWELLEHQPSIYPWSNKGEQIIPDTNVINYWEVAAPTNLQISTPNDGTAQAIITWNSVYKSFLVGIDGEYNTITANKSFPLNNLPTGTRTFKVKAVNGLGYRSPYATLEFEISTPQIPTVTVSIGTFDISVTPSVTGSYLGLSFELIINTVDDINTGENKGKSGSFTLAGLQPSTTYYLWVRTVNVAGESGWATKTVVTKDGQEIRDVVGELDPIDLIEIEKELSTIPHQWDSVVGDINNIVFETLGEKERITGIKRVDETIATETEARVTSIEQLTAVVDDNVAEIISVSNAVATKASQSALLSLTTRVTAEEENSASTSLILTATNNEVDGLKAQAYLGTDINGRVSGLFIDSDAARTDIEFLGDKASFVHPDTLEKMIRFDLTTREFVFDGKIISVSGEIGGWKIDSNYIYSGSSPTTSDTYASSGITLYSGVSGSAIRSKNFRVDKNGDAFFRGDISGANGNFTGTLSGADISGASGTFGGYINITSSNNVPVQAVTNSNNTVALQAGYFVNFSTVSGRQGVFAGAAAANGIALKASATGLLSKGVSSYGTSSAFYAEGGGYAPFTGSHEGLLPKSDDEIIQGDIVCDVKLVSMSDISNAICEMELSSKPNQKSARGVAVHRGELSTGNVAAFDDEIETHQWAYIYDLIGFNALGEGAINVCGEGGDIEVGDLITTSNMAGKGMKQLDQDNLKPYTVAQSRQNVTFSSADEVIQIAVIYKCG